MKAWCLGWVYGKAPPKITGGLFFHTQNGNNRMGIQAASTYLRFNPKDDQMHDNMKYYSGLPELQDIIVDEIESLAPIEHHELFEKGRKAYNAKNYEKCVEYLEASIKQYTKAYKECKTFCEVEVEGRQQYISGGVYGYHMQVLLCTLHCPRRLSMMLNYPQPGFLSKQFDFLHYSYTQCKYFKVQAPTHFLCHAIIDTRHFPRAIHVTARQLNEPPGSQ